VRPPPTLTVVTPTWNRAHTLPRLFDSLVRQGWPGLEWLVVDDGSSDGTAELVRRLGRSAPFPVRCLAQPNGGRHTALNRGFAEAAGEFVVVMDSDDWLEQGALRSFVDAWDSIPPQERAHFAAVAGLCADPGGALIGTAYPADPCDSDFVALRAAHRVAGDKKEMFRTEAVRALPFPVFPGERRVPFSHLLVRLSRRWRVRFFNRVVARKEYRADGMTARVDALRMQSPLGSRAGYLEWLHAPGPLPVRFRLRHCANYVRYSLHAGIGWTEQRRDLASPLLWLGAAPLGAALWWRDRLRLGGAEGRAPRRAAAP